jgi:NADH-quinone oxidoreductase subunit G
MPTITIDGRELRVPDGMLLEALDAAGVLGDGVEIPHYCWHPKLSIDGSCRLCQVEVEGMPKLQVACNTPVRDGMVVHTTSARVRDAREGVLELLLVDHPLDCPICDQAGECKLQDHVHDHGPAAARSREPRRAARKNDALGPTIVFDQERCILCRRCVRFCREIPGTGELAVVNRGDESAIEAFPGIPLDNDYSMNVADLCPVGALTTRDFRFKVRAWFLDDVPGICTGCANGCNVDLSVYRGEVHRYLPRRNDEVNDTWLCDAGRLSYRRIGAPDRIRTPRLRGEHGVLEETTWDEAIAAAAARLASLAEAKGPGVVAGLASPHATNEDLFTFGRFLDAIGAGSRGVAVVRGAADALLVKEERAANGTGARALGFEDARSCLDRIRNGGVEGLVVMGHDVLHEQYLGGTEALEGVDTLILIDSHGSALERAAHVVLPARVVAEKTGTLTSHAGRVQRVEPAVLPRFDARDEGEIVTRLGAAMALPGFGSFYDARAIGRLLAASQPAFAGCDWEGVGPGGRKLSGAGA